MREYSGKWDEHYRASGGAEVAVDDWLAGHLAELGKPENWPVIDLGCGLGNNTRYLDERGIPTVACDYSEVALEAVRRRFPRAETRHLDLRDGLPFADATVRLCIADLSLHYFDWPTSLFILGEIRRVLVPGGRLYCRVNSTRDHNHGAGVGEEIEHNFFAGPAGHKRFFDRPMIDALFGAVFILHACEEKTMQRYEKEKWLWEFEAEKSA